MNMPSTIAGSVGVEQGLGAALIGQINSFAQDLFNKQIGYAPVPNSLGRVGNSNSAAAYVMRMLGINPNALSYKGNPVGLEVDLSSQRFGPPSPDFYASRAHAEYMDWMLGDQVPTPSPSPTVPLTPISAPTTAPISVPLTPISAPMVAPVPRAPIAVPSMSMARPPSMPVPMTGVSGFASCSGSSGGYNDGRGDPAPLGGYGDSYGGPSGGGGRATGSAPGGGGRPRAAHRAAERGAAQVEEVRGAMAATPRRRAVGQRPLADRVAGSYSEWNGPDEGSRGRGAATSGGYQSGGGGTVDANGPSN